MRPKLFGLGFLPLFVFPQALEPLFTYMLDHSVPVKTSS